MQTIKLKKFGTVLVSRPAGLEAFQAIRSVLDVTQPVAIDFDGVSSVAPSWFDEFITQVSEHFRGQVELLPTDNASVRALLPGLTKDRHDAAANVLRRAMDNMGLSS